MNFKRIAAVVVAAAILGSSTYVTTDALLFKEVITVSAATSSLRKNSTGSEVTKLQNNLIKLNYLKSGSATGTYDTATENAVKKFQSDYHLTADGVAGTQTLNMINSVISGTSKTIEVKATLLNVRATASPNGKLITTVKAGQKFTVEGEASESDGTKWYKIKTGVGSGYVCSDYVEVTVNSAQPAQNSNAKSGIIKVTGNVLNVRKTASTSAQKLYTVKAGQTYYFTDVKTVSGEKWYYIKVNKNVSGWVLGKWATPIETNENTTSSAKSGKLKVIVDILQVRQSTSTTSKRLYTTKRDEEYSYSNVKTVDGVKWYYIKVNSSISGWVLGTMVSATPKDALTTIQTTKKTTIVTSTDPNGGTVTVAVDQLNVRESTSTSSKKLFTAKRDAVYTYSKTQKVDGVEWYYIKINNSISGWVMGNYVTAKPNSTTAKSTKETTKSTQADSGKTSGKLTVTAEVLNVRGDASAKAKIVTTVKKNTSYSFTNIKTVGNEKWYYITVSSSKKGWVLGNYVKVTPEKETTQTSTKTGTLTVIGASVNVRSGAGTNYDKITTVKKDAKFTYTDTKNNWYCIKLSSGKSGWIIGDYVKIDDSDTTTAGNTTTKTTTIKATDATPSESEHLSPDTSEAKPTTSKSAETSATASVTSKTEITTTGVPISPTAVASLTKNVVTGTVNCTSSSLVVRKGPGTSYASIGSVKKGATVVIVSKGSAWHQIEYGNGKGYVNASYIKNIKTTVKADGMSYAGDYYYLNVGQSINLGRTMKGSVVTYSSSDQSKCPVTDAGVASGVKEGLYTITAKCGSVTSSVCVVVLKNPNSNVQQFKISEKGAEFIANWEGGETILPNGKKVFYPYKDVSGFWTLGYGHAKTATASKSWSEERAITEFNSDIVKLIGEDYILTDNRPYLTESAAKLLLNADLNNGDYVKSINNWAVRNGVKLNQAQFDALVSFCYNIGPSLWDSDTNKFYLKAAILSHRDGSKAVSDQIIDGFCRYHKSNGLPYKGLWYRRRNEAELFISGDYKIDRENKFKLPSDVNWL